MFGSFKYPVGVTILTGVAIGILVVILFGRFPFEQETLRPTMSVEPEALATRDDSGGMGELAMIAVAILSILVCLLFWLHLRAAKCYWLQSQTIDVISGRADLHGKHIKTIYRRLAHAGIGPLPEESRSEDESPPG